jgi:flagellin-like hook-associated protein FlgL
MSIMGVSPNIAPLVQSALDINKKLTTLQQQLSTGQKSTSYNGLGAQSGIAVSLNAQLAAMTSFNDTITSVGTNISLQQQVLQQIASVAATTR